MDSFDREVIVLGASVLKIMVELDLNGELEIGNGTLDYHITKKFGR